MSFKEFFRFFFSEIDSDIKVLEDQFDEIIVDLATKRKQYPRKILECVIKTLKAQHEAMVR
jgi:kinetochore-associated protein NSL1